MRGKTLILAGIILFAATQAYAANGDLIVDGNAGIGTTVPTTRLDVRGGVSIGRDVSTTPAYWNLYQLYMQNNASIGTQGSYASHWAWNWARTGNSSFALLGGADVNNSTTANAIKLSDSGISFHSEGSYGATVEPLSRMIIKPTGNVGIGTTTPEGQLDVQGKSLFKLGNMYINSNLVPANYYQRFSLGYGIYWDDANGNYKVTDPTYNQATFSNENGKFVWTLHVGALTSPQTYSGWHANDKMIIYPQGNVVFGGSGFSNKYIAVRDGGVGGGYFGLDAALNGASGGYILLAGTQKTLNFAAGSDTWGTAPQMTLTPTGNFGIGTTSPAYTLDVNGTIRGTNVSPSDRRLKENIQPFESALDKVVQIKGVTFNWKKGDATGKHFPEGTHYGVIAQEIEKILPEVVSTDTEGYKSVAYTEIIPVLVEGIKEQQKIIEQLELRLKKLEQKISN